MNPLEAASTCEILPAARGYSGYDTETEDKRTMGPLRRATSQESTSSVSSTSSQRISGHHHRDSSHEYATTAAVTTSYSRHLSDISAVLIHCPKHDRFGLVQCAGHKGLWLPYVSLKQSEGWYAAIVNKLRHLLGVKIGVKSSTVFTPPEIMHIMRIQLPEVLKYVTRVIFMTNLQSMAVSSPSATNSANLHKPQAAAAAAAAPPTSTTGQGPDNGSASSPADIEGRSRSSGETNLSQKVSSSLSTAAQQQQPQQQQAASFRCLCDHQPDGSHAGGLRWYKHEQLVTDEELLEIWGPEPGILTSAFATSSVEKGAYSEYTLREAIRFQPRDPPRTHHEEMLRACHFERGDILRLYSDYVQHCFPSQNMNYVSFRDYMIKLGYEPAGATPIAVSSTGSGGASQSANHSTSASKSNQQQQAGSSATVQLGSGLNVHDMRSLYRSFKFNRSNPYVTFHELLLGLAAMDRSTPHGGHCGELRCAYIFRYYDFNGDGRLSSNELKTMALDRLRLASIKHAQTVHKSDGVAQIAAAKSTSASRSTSGSAKSAALAAAANQRIDSDSANLELQRMYKMLNLKPGESISELNFMLAVGSMQLRGTSPLFRSQVSALPVKQHYEVITERQALTDIEGNLVGSELQKKGTCPRCKEKRYVLALHTVKMTHDAQIVEPTEVRFDEYPPPISRAQRQLSRAIFASDSTPNKLIDMITNYWNAVAAANNSSGGGGSMATRLLLGAANAVPLGKTTWELIDRRILAEDIKRVCSQADVIFKREARVVGVNSPCFVLGDIHGNLNDLRVYERILWPNAPTCVPGSFLFLGDYVDRGDYGLECICYLLSMKVLAPKVFFLLRGNHELRSIQQAFTFFREVCEKFRNQQLGVQVWETLNKTFDIMPVAATIDDQIFCSHGGIPTSATRLDELYNIPTPLADPENQSAPAWEILWNDPVSATEYSEYSDLLRRQPGGQQAVANMQGYLPNTKRGTAFFFSEEAVKRFLHLNNMSHIIRAHECVPPGYALHCNGKVITIFSSSHYCGATNDAACILVEREKLRIIRLDTD